MQYVKEQGETYADALKNFRSKFGTDVFISEERQIPAQSIWGKLTGKKIYEIHGAIKEKSRTPARPIESFDSKMKILDEMLKRTSQQRQPLALNTQDNQLIERNLNVPLRREISETPVTNFSNDTIRKLESEVTLLKAELKEKDFLGLDRINERELISLFDYLLYMGFSQKFASQMVTQTREQLPSTDLKLRKKIHEKTRLVLSERIRTQVFSEAHRIISLVGPTGAGKTTTLVKLAAKLIVNDKKRVALITIDNYRIAATEQLKVYARILDVPCHVCRTPLELSDAVKQINADYIFVDTSGSSPINNEFINRQKTFLDAIEAQHELETQLVIPAQTRLQDATLLFDRFDVFDFSKIIMSKIDESYSFAPIVELADQWHKPFSFLTNGQDVGKDYLLADRMIMADALLKKWLDEVHSNDRQLI